MTVAFVSVAALDAMSAAEAGALLSDCCGARRWVSGMVARRPFVSFTRARAAALEVWATLRSADWREAFARHPRIGEQASLEPQGAPGRQWSADEQKGITTVPSEIRAALATVNREYEERFGYLYIVCAAGKSAEVLLDVARERLKNEPERELSVAAEELRQIMQLRLAKLLTHDERGDA